MSTGIALKLSVSIEFCVRQIVMGNFEIRIGENFREHIIEKIMPVFLFFVLVYMEGILFKHRCKLFAL